MFTVAWESVDDDGWKDMHAVWKRQTKGYETEDAAVAAWLSFALYVNTRPVSIDPEPDWSRYTYDGRTFVRKW